MELKFDLLDDETLFTTVFVIVDDSYTSLNFQQKDDFRRGPTPKLSDSEVITLEVMRELKGMDSQKRWIKYLKNQWLYLFPGLNERSRYHRRVKDLCRIINLIRIKVLELLNIPYETHYLIDSLPIPVCHYARSGRAKAFKGEAEFGYCEAKDEKFFGFKLHMVATIMSIPVNFVLAPGNRHDVCLVPELLEPLSNVVIGGDKGYVGSLLKEELVQEKNIHFVAKPRDNQKERLSPGDAWFLKHFRKTIETLFSQLTEYFHANVVKAKTLWGLITNLSTKITAYTLGVYLSKSVATNRN